MLAVFFQSSSWKAIAQTFSATILLRTPEPVTPWKFFCLNYKMLCSVLFVKELEGNERNRGIHDIIYLKLQCISPVKQRYRYRRIKGQNNVIIILQHGLVLQFTYSVGSTCFRLADLRTYAMLKTFLWRKPVLASFIQ